MHVSLVITNGIFVNSLKFLF